MCAPEIRSPILTIRPYRVPDEPDYCADQLLNEEIAEMMSPDRDYHPEDWPMPENEIYRNVEEHPFIHSCDVEEMIPCAIDVTTFRNADRSLRTEVNFEVPANEIKFFGEGDAHGAAVEFRVLVRDSTMREIAFDRDRVGITAAGFSPVQMLIPGQVAFHLKPGHFWMVSRHTTTIRRGERRWLKEIELAPYAVRPLSATSSSRAASGRPRRTGDS